MTNENSVQFLVILVTENTDSEDIFNATLQLYKEFLDTEASSVEIYPNTQNLPEGVKSGDSITFGAIALAVSVAALPNLLLLIQNWLLRQKDQKLKVKIGEVEIEVPRDATPTEIGEIAEIIKSISR